jgi:hypothetical protein
MLIGHDSNLIYDSGWVSNTVVDRCRVLLAGFMKNELSSGIQCLAVGKGNEDWDTAGVPVPDPVQATNLVTRYDPAIPFSDLDVVYLDENDEVSPEYEPTSRLQITVTLVPGYPVPESSLSTYPLREFGLFGNADGTYMINYVRHPVIHKHESATLIRVIRLYF